MNTCSWGREVLCYLVKIELTNLREANSNRSKWNIPRSKFANEFMVKREKKIKANKEYQKAGQLYSVLFYSIP